jgi:hypothetical protein
VGFVGLLMQIQAECDDSNKYIQQWGVPDPYAREMLVVKGVVVPVSQICGWWWRSPLEEAPQICRWRPP